MLLGRYCNWHFTNEDQLEMEVLSDTLSRKNILQEHPTRLFYTMLTKQFFVMVSSKGTTNILGYLAKNSLYYEITN